MALLDYLIDLVMTQLNDLFFREYQSSVFLSSHKNILKIFDVVFQSEGYFMFATEVSHRQISSPRFSRNFFIISKCFVDFLILVVPNGYAMFVYCTQCTVQANLCGVFCRDENVC
jgi:hypothetical protein